MDKDTSWFEDEEWQVKEREADNDFKRGAFDKVDTIDELSALFDVKEKEIYEDNYFKYDEEEGEFVVCHPDDVVITEEALKRAIRTQKKIDEEGK